MVVPGPLWRQDFLWISMPVGKGLTLEARVVQLQAENEREGCKMRSKPHPDVANLEE